MLSQKLEHRQGDDWSDMQAYKILPKYAELHVFVMSRGGRHPRTQYTDEGDKLALNPCSSMTLTPHAIGDSRGF
jgi:hypothetical protein